MSKNYINRYSSEKKTSPLSFFYLICAVSSLGRQTPAEEQGYPGLPTVPDCGLDFSVWDSSSPTFHSHWPITGCCNRAKIHANVAKVDDGVFWSTLRSLVFGSVPRLGSRKSWWAWFCANMSEPAKEKRLCWEAKRPWVRAVTKDARKAFCTVCCRETDH